MTNQISPKAISAAYPEALALHFERTYDRAPFIEDNGERQTIDPAAFGEE